MVASDYLKATIPIFSRTCHQYIIYNKKRVLSNIHSIDLVMSYSGYRRIHSKSSRYFATYISSTYPLGWSLVCLQSFSMRFYQFVWFILLSYMGARGLLPFSGNTVAIQSLSGKGSFWGVSIDLMLEDDDFISRRLFLSWMSRWARYWWYPHSKQEYVSRTYRKW